MSTPRITAFRAAVVCLAVGLAADAGSIYEDAPYQTPQFTPNVTHRTDLCERQVSWMLPSR